MKNQRVIHLLADGRRKYSTHHGEIELWSESDISALRKNLELLGAAAYTFDFSKYDVEAKELRRRYPRAKIVRVIGYVAEDHDLPIDESVIF